MPLRRCVGWTVTQPTPPVGSRARARYDPVAVEGREGTLRLEDTAFPPDGIGAGMRAESTPLRQEEGVGFLGCDQSDCWIHRSTFLLSARMTVRRMKSGRTSRRQGRCLIETKAQRRNHGARAAMGLDAGQGRSMRSGGGQMRCVQVRTATMSSQLRRTWSISSSR